MVRHYRALGVHYFQIYNEPNLPSENQDQRPDVDRYLHFWLPAARQVVAGGGLPGFGALAPGADVNDIAFFREAVEKIVTRGHAEVLDHAWVAVHNYLQGGPSVRVEEDSGFLRPQAYDRILQETLGRSLPMIGTEGGFPPNHPPLDSDDAARRLQAAYAAVARGEPRYVFAYTYWLLANEAGGGADPAFRDQALFRLEGATPLVEVLKRSP